MAQKYLADLIQLGVRQEKSTLSNLVIRSYLLTGKEDKTQIYFGNNLQRDTLEKKRGECSLLTVLLVFTWTSAMLRLSLSG